MTTSNANDNQTADRPIANFTPSIWGDLFLNYSPLSDETKKKEVQRELKVQVEEQFRVLLANYDFINPLELLTFIDTIERLGVSFRFNALIEQSLQAIFESLSDQTTCLHLVSLRFRLLRQHGFYAPTGVFETILKDEEKGCFKKSITSDVQGMLSLYDATHLRVHGEDILDEALDFTRFHLKSIDTGKLSPMLSSLVTRSLNIPLHKAMTLLESRHFISIYEQDDAHNKTLLRFAETEFNLLQSIFKEELMHLSRWWEDLKMELKLPFVIRDRVVEMYFWGLGALYEPQYSSARWFFTKIVKLISIMDDIYDAYGTIDELEPFHAVIERWDISYAEELPEYMKLVIKALMDTHKEVEQCLVKEGRSHLIRYAIQETKDISGAYLREARWRDKEHTPTFDEYMNEAAVLSFGNKWAMATCFLGMGDIAMEEAFDWLSGNPLVVDGGGRHGRLVNDMVSRKFERERWHISSAAECYMRENGATKEETHTVFHAQLELLWKDMNQAMLRPTVIPRPLLGIQLGFDRVVNLIYKDEDSYTFPENSMKNYASLLLVNPIPE